MRREVWARVILGSLLAAGLLVPALAFGLARQDRVEVQARMAEAGGWTPAALTATVGQPLHLRLISDDVTHGFAVGQMDWPALDLPPGQPVETTLAFDRPGRYTFYCTRWCGLGHWRMRGVIEVTGPTPAMVPSDPPLYVRLGLDLDAPRAPAPTPSQKPSAARGAALAVALPHPAYTVDQLRGLSPLQVWRALSDAPATNELTDSELWDVVAFLWQEKTAPGTLAEGRRLYASNCAACHGEDGNGDGVYAPALAHRADHARTEFGHQTQAPVAFTDPAAMLSASPALLQGKLIRGGMGTGMPAWGALFTEAQTWALVDYLWTFQFDYKEAP